MSETGAVLWFVYGYVVVAIVLYVVVEEVRDRMGRVPVLDPAWDAIRAGMRWCLRVPGRGLRWLRGDRDTPPGLGGP